MNEVSRSIIWCIIRDDLNLRKVAAWWVPRSLTDKLKGQRMKAEINFLQRYSIEDKDFLDHIITSNEMWVHHYTPPTKKALMVQKATHEPAPKKFQTQNLQRNSCCLSFGIGGSHSSGVPIKGEEFNGECEEVFRNHLQFQDFHQEQTSRLIEQWCCLSS